MRELTEEEIRELPMAQYFGLIDPYFASQSLRKESNGDISVLLEEPIGKAELHAAGGSPRGAYQIYQNDDGKYEMTIMGSAKAIISENSIVVEQKQGDYPYYIEKQTIKLEGGTVQSTICCATAKENRVADLQIKDDVYSLDGEKISEALAVGSLPQGITSFNNAGAILYGTGNYNPDSNNRYIIDLDRIVKYQQQYSNIVVSEIDPQTREEIPAGVIQGENNIDAAIQKNISVMMESRTI